MSIKGAVKKREEILGLKRRKSNLVRVYRRMSRARLSKSRARSQAGHGRCSFVAPWKARRNRNLIRRCSPSARPTLAAPGTNCGPRENPHPAHRALSWGLPAPPRACTESAIGTRQQGGMSQLHLITAGLGREGFRRRPRASWPKQLGVAGFLRLLEKLQLHRLLNCEAADLQARTISSSKSCKPTAESSAPSRTPPFWLPSHPCGDSTPTAWL